MLAADRMMPLLMKPWHTHAGNPLPVKPLPGLCVEVIEGLEPFYPGILTPDSRQLLRTAAGLVGTQLGDIDFTGRWHPEEPLSVFRPCLSLLLDENNRRWIAETAGEVGLPGPVWCVFPNPPVAVYVSDDLSGFVSSLRAAEESEGLTYFVHGLSRIARSIWDHRHALACRFQRACRCDGGMRGWTYRLPPDAGVFDLRRPTHARGWPYGLCGPSACLYHCGRLPVFAVAGPPTLEECTPPRLSEASSSPLRAS